MTQKQRCHTRLLDFSRDPNRRSASCRDRGQDGLRVHETKALDPVDMTIRDGIPVTTPERLPLDLGAVCHQSVVEMATDTAEARGLVTPSSMRRTLERLGRRGRNGAGVLRAVLELHYGRSAVPESDMETMLFQVLRRNGLPTPVAQYEIRQDGTFVARVDAAYPDLRIAIEYDSTKHHAGRVLASPRSNNSTYATQEPGG